MGNFETKHSPYYAITDESCTTADCDKSTQILENSHSLWVIKRASFESDCKNSSLFEFNNKLIQNDSKAKSNRQLILALNQIKVSIFSLDVCQNYSL